MKFLDSTLAAHKIRIIEGSKHYPGSSSPMIKILDEVTGKTYLVKKIAISKNFSDMDASGYIERAAVLEKISSKFYQFLSPDAHIASVEIIVFKNGSLGIASEFIEDYAPIFPSKLSIIDGDIITFQNEEQITLEPNSVFSLYLSARLIDDFDAIGTGFNSGLTKDEGKIRLARIDTDGLKFAHTNQHIRKYYAPFGLLALISKMINQKYLDPKNPGYWTNYPISMIVYDETGASLNQAYNVANGFIKLYFRQASIKDILFGSLEYSSIIRNELLFKSFAESLFRITSITDEELWDLINSGIPNKINSQDILLNKKILHQILIIRREQLKHLYLVEYEFVRLGFRKDDYHLSFQETLEVAKKIANYNEQSIKIKKAIDNLKLENLSEISCQLFEELSGSFVPTRSLSVFTIDAIKNSISNIINSLFKKKLKTSFPGIPPHIVDIIINSVAGINTLIILHNDYLLNDQMEEESTLLSLSQKITLLIDESSDLTCDIYMEDNFIVVTQGEKILKIIMEKAELILSLFNEVKSSVKESGLLDLLSKDEFFILREILLDNEISKDFEIMFILLSTNEEFKQLLNIELTIYTLPDGSYYIKTSHEDDITSFSIATLVEKMKKNGDEINEKKTSLLLQVVENGNIALAELLIEFGARLLPYEQLPEEFSYLYGLIEEKNDSEMSVNLHLSQTLEEHLLEEEDYDFIQAIINSIIDTVTSLKTFPILMETRSGFPAHPYYYSGGSHDPGDEGGYGGGGSQFAAAASPNNTELTVVPFIGINSTAALCDN